MSATPQTDAAVEDTILHDRNHPRIDWVPASFARKLERERDAAIEHWEEVREYGTDEINASVDLRQKLAQALVELDNMQDQRDLAMKVISRLERERDEARENLDEEMKFHHRTHAELVQTQCKLLDMESMRDHAKQMERERDEAREQNVKVRDIADTAIEYVGHTSVQQKLRSELK